MMILITNQGLTLSAPTGPGGQHPGILQYRHNLVYNVFFAQAIFLIDSLNSAVLGGKLVD